MIKTPKRPLTVQDTKIRYSRWDRQTEPARRNLWSLQDVGQQTHRQKEPAKTCGSNSRQVWIFIILMRGIKQVLEESGRHRKNKTGKMRCKRVCVRPALQVTLDAGFISSLPLLYISINLRPPQGVPLFPILCHPPKPSSLEVIYFFLHVCDSFRQPTGMVIHTFLCKHPHPLHRQGTQ